MINKFIGSGMIFPIEINNDGRPTLYNDVRLINSSILAIINWPYSQRFFNEKFGCRVHELLEEPNDDITKTLLSHFIVETLTTWENRILINNSGVKIKSFDNDKVDIQLTFKINSTKTEHTFIYPFYKKIIY